MEKISRKGFLKVAAAAAMSGVTAGALAACNSAASSSTAASGDAIYTPGTYTGTATGIGEVKVTMTFSETAITDVVWILPTRPRASAAWLPPPCRKR